MRSSAWCLAVVLTILGSAAADAQCDSPIDLGRGPVNFHVPGSYKPANPAPLVILLHGYGGTGDVQEDYMRFRPMANRFGYLYAYPDGTRDTNGFQFWNGTDACCDLFGSGVDDSGYLLDLVEAIEGQCNVDPRKIYFTGHSNGGFMSYRMACDHSDRVAAIASLAGATWFDPDDCSPNVPVQALQVHGTADATILFGGGGINGIRYPGAVRSAETWAAYNSCNASSTPPPRALNLDAGQPGAETTRSRYAASCSAGGGAELWTIDNGVHTPDLTANYAKEVSKYLLAHPKVGECSGDERVVDKGCSPSNRLVVKLRGGLARDGYRVEVGSGESVYGVLNAKGKATVRLRQLPDGADVAQVTFGCGETLPVEFECN